MDLERLLATLRDDHEACLVEAWGWWYLWTRDGRTTVAVEVVRAARRAEQIKLVGIVDGRFYHKHIDYTYRGG